MISKNRKLTILYVLKILKDGTNQFNPITQAVITRTINLLGIDCDRKTVARDIDCLIKFGYDIKKVPGGGCYLVNEEFKPAEVNQIIYCVNNSNLTFERKTTLCKKLSKLININER